MGESINLVKYLPTPIFESIGTNCLLEKKAEMRTSSEEFKFYNLCKEELLFIEITTILKPILYHILWISQKFYAQLPKSVTYVYFIIIHFNLTFITVEVTFSIF